MASKETDDTDMSHDGSGDQHPAKRQKTESRGLFKPPTHEELHMLSEGSDHIQSSLFKLQVEELHKEMKVTEVKRKVITEGLEKLKDVLMSLPEIEVENVWDTSWLTKDIKVPWKWGGQFIKGGMKLQKPVAIELSGSFPLDTCSKSSLTIDVVVKMPTTVIHVKDYLNFRYQHKRAIYCAFMATHLKDHDIIEDLKFTYSNGDYLRPMLSVILKGKSLKHVTFSLHPCPPDGAFKFSRFNPVMSNIRSQWYNNSQQKEEKFPATPHYNSSLLCDMCMEKHLQHMLEVSRDFPSFRESLMILRVWLHQRELDKGPGGFTPFLAAMLISYLLQETKLSKQMKSQQIIKTTLNYLAQSNWTEHGIGLTPDVIDSCTPPSRDDFHSAFGVVFIDQTGFLNLCAEMSKNTYEQVKFEASCTVDFLGDPTVDSFELLCMTPVCFTRKYDQFIQIQDLSWLKAYCRKLNLEHSLMERKDLAMFVALPHLLVLMEKALGQRIRAIGVRPFQVPEWSIDGSVIGYGRMKTLTFGLLLNDEYAFNVLDKGPDASSPEAAEFKEFWGEKSEMRRFHDGSICEAVLWPGKRVAEKRLACLHVVKHILHKATGASPKIVTIVANQFDPLIKPAKISCQKQMEKSTLLGTGEEQHLEVFAAYQELSKYLRQLKDIPLGISSVQGISPVFRHTEVFPPLTPWRNRNTQATDGGFDVPTEEMPLPEFLPCFKVICHLEDSSKWPNSLEAIEKVKSAFYIEISKLLKTQMNVLSSVTEKYLDVLQAGFIFRIDVAHVKELGLLKEGRSKLGHLVLQDNEASIQLEKRTVTLPKVTSALHGVFQEHKSFGLTARLAKRWISAQLLSDHVPDEAVELLVAHLYLHPAPFTAPRTLVTGFQRFLHMLVSFDWANKVLIVNLNSELQVSDFEDVRQHFTNNRSQLPVMCIITPTDRNSVWTREQPTQMIINRLQILAQGSLRCIEDQLLKGSAQSAFKTIFRPPMEGYDVLIKLKSTIITRRREAVDAEEDETLKFRKLVSDRDTTTLPVIDFDPVKSYITDLKDAFSDHAMFFYDQFGGNVIGVKWRVPAFDAKPTKVSSMTVAMPNETSENILSTVVPNTNGILTDFQVIGNGLVESIEVFSKNWKIK